MPRVDTRAVFAALALATAPAARAQTVNVAGEALPSVTLPNQTAAGAEEPAGLGVNPAAPGFVRGFSAQYFHDHRDRSAFRGDALFLSTPLGALVPTMALDWIRPDTTSRFRRTTLGVALGGDAVSLGYSFTWFSSPDADLDRVTSWQAGMTIRPTRWLSIAGSALDRGMSLDRTPLPARYDLGVAGRFWRDRITVSSDLLVSDRTRNAFEPYGIGFGVAAEVRRGLVVNAQIQAPINSPGLSTSTVLALTWNEAFLGFTGGYSNRGSGTPDAWVFGVRTSSEAYRAARREPARTVRVDLARDLEPGGFLIFPGKEDPYGALLAKLRDLRDDPAVRDVEVVVADLPIGGGRTQELRSAIAEIAARKPVTTYVRGGRIREYWLATAATTIAAPPSGVIDLSGLASTTPFLRDGLARIGVAFEVVAAGQYKNAPDPLVRSDMSEAQREVTNDVLDRVFETIVHDVAAGRHLPEESVRGWIDQALFTAPDAKSAGLVDRVSWPDELGTREHPPASYRRPEPRRAQRWGPRPVIAVVPVEGAIVQGRSRRVPLYGQAIGDETIAREIRRAADAPDVKAIVLRIDSPGGDAVASDLIWREAAVARSRGKPVIASMGDVAASGGYLVACAADAIVAQPATLTGSIGVFVVKPELSGLLAKLGVNTVTVKRGENATLRSTTRPWSPSERAAVERGIRGFYDVFLSRVAEGRRMSKEDVERVAGGRVWTGAEALDRGLVDRLGSLADAIALARERAHLGDDDDVTIRRFAPKRGFLSSLGAGAARGDVLSGLAERLPELGAAGLLLEIGAPVALPTEWVSGGAPADPPR